MIGEIPHAGSRRGPADKTGSVADDASCIPVDTVRSADIFLRKEVIQPQVPLRLPCYDLVPIRSFIFGACLATPATSDAPPFGGLTGGVYKAQEHIHRGNADPRLLAIPTSCTRIAECNLNWGTVFAICSTSRSCVALSGPL